MRSSTVPIGECTLVCCGGSCVVRDDGPRAGSTRVRAGFAANQLILTEIPESELLVMKKIHVV